MPPISPGKERQIPKSTMIYTYSDNHIVVMYFPAQWQDIQLFNNGERHGGTIGTR